MTLFAPEGAGLAAAADIVLAPFSQDGRTGVVVRALVVVAGIGGG